MSLDNRPQHADPLTKVDQLVAFFQQGEKPPARHLVGMEHEKIGVLTGTLAPIPYEGPRGIGELLGRLSRFGYQPFLENDKPIAATQPKLSISLEPGGQFELSGRPFHCCNDLAQELRRHLALMRALGAELGHTWLGVGYRPFGLPTEAHWMPKGRYVRMREHLASVGNHGIDMMTMTGTVQANFDYLDEADMVRKVQCASRISPLVTALFANSPLRNGQKTGYLTFRAHVWRDVDKARCGLRPEFFAEGFGYRAYTEWALDIPLIFVRRAHAYHDPRGLTFRRFLAEGFEGQPPTLSDWEDHLTTLFPEIRLKQVIEVRGADMGDAAMCVALPALWKGLFYDRAALEAAAALVPVAPEDLDALTDTIAKHGLAARVGHRNVGELCGELVRLSAHGLRGQSRCGPDEGQYLDVLREELARGRTPAEEALLRLDGEFHGDVEQLISHWRVA